MPWARRRFRGQLVWVNVDPEGRLVLDREGRAEMKYREADERVYRPSPRNLEPAGDEAGEDRAPLPPSAAAPPEPAAAPPPRERAPGDKRLATRSAPGHVVHIWTDGACTGNPGPMGIGVVIINGTHRREHGEYLGRGTNNIAELVAIERGLDLAQEIYGEDLPRVRIYTDSQYAIGVLSLGWKAKANQELVGRIRQRLTAFRQKELVKVAGHAGVPDNERCDELARDAIRQGHRA